MAFGARKLSEEQRSEARSHHGDRTTIIRRIAAAYPPVVRAYCLIRFLIIRARILGVMDVLLPERGRILELGCGFGLFAGYFSLQSPGRTVVGFDRDAKRIAMATEMARRLGAGARFEQADIRDLPASDRFDAAYLLDVLHHIPYDDQEPVLREVHRRLTPGATLLLKDITVYPTYKLAFTWALDRVMAPHDKLSYRHHHDMALLLERVGFEVRVRHLDDHLPYPHVLYICRRREEPTNASP